MKPPGNYKPTFWGDGEFQCGLRLLLASNLNYILMLFTDIFQRYHHCTYAACVKFTNTEVNAIYIDQQLTLLWLKGPYNMLSITMDVHCCIAYRNLSIVHSILQIYRQNILIRLKNLFLSVSWEVIEM